MKEEWKTIPRQREVNNKSRNNLGKILEPIPKAVFMLQNLISSNTAIVEAFQKPTEIGTYKSINRSYKKDSVKGYPNPKSTTSSYSAT